MLVSIFFGVVAALYLVLDKRGCVYSYSSPFARKNAIAISTSLAFLKCDAPGKNEKSQKQNHENDAKFKFC